MSNLATHLTKLESVIVSTLRRPASLCDKSCCASVKLAIANPLQVNSTQNSAPCDAFLANKPVDDSTFEGRTGKQVRLEHPAIRLSKGQR